MIVVGGSPMGDRIAWSCLHLITQWVHLTVMAGYRSSIAAISGFGSIWVDNLNFIQLCSHNLSFNSFTKNSEGWIWTNKCPNTVPVSNWFFGNFLLPQGEFCISTLRIYWINLGCDPGTAPLAVWRATNEPTHHLVLFCYLFTEGEGKPPEILRLLQQRQLDGVFQLEISCVKPTADITNRERSFLNIMDLI